MLRRDNDVCLFDTHSIGQIGENSRENRVVRQEINEQKSAHVPEEQRTFFAVEKNVAERTFVVYNRENEKKGSLNIDVLPMNKRLSVKSFRPAAGRTWNS